MAEFTSSQFADRPEGPHCESTKIWPFCVSATGLGLKLYDATKGTSLQNPYDDWCEYAQRHYMGLTRRGELDWFAMYYDPIKREAATLPEGLTGYMSLVILPYVLPQQPEWGQRLYELSMRSLGWSNPRARLNQFHPDPRWLSVGYLIAKELGDSTTADRLAAVIEREFEPRFFGEDDSRFGYFFGWGEEWPRGQQSALLMAGDLTTPGSWSKPFNEPNLTKFTEPTVEGVDFPTLGISTAHNLPGAGELHVSTYAATPAARRTPTTWRVTQLADPRNVRVLCDGQAFENWRVIDDSTIEVSLDVDSHDLIFATGSREANERPRDAGQYRAGISRPATQVTATQISSPPTAQSVTCSCCAAN